MQADVLDTPTSLNFLQFPLIGYQKKSHFDFVWLESYIKASL